MRYLTNKKQNDVIATFTSTARYLDNLPIVDKFFFEHMNHRIYGAELQLNNANFSDIKAPFSDLSLSV